MNTIILAIGIVALVASFTIPPSPQSTNTIRTMRIFSALALLIGTLTSLFVVIEPGLVGVQSTFGKVNNTVLPSGLRIVNPISKITEFDVRTQNYTMSGVHDEGHKQGDDAIRALTKDGLEISIDLSVLYRLQPDQCPTILQTIGEDYEEKIIRPLSRTRIRDNAVFYEAVELFSSKRDEFQQRIFKTLETDFLQRGIRLEQMLIRNIILPASVKATIESKINAEQEAQKMQFVLQKEQQEAERKRVEAQGIADYQRIINTGLSDNQLRYESIKAYKELANSPNTKIVVLGGANSKTPIILND
jgi:regulator of protease activity HflC (stomatin/prohibitin superfamily)